MRLTLLLTVVVTSVLLASNVGYALNILGIFPYEGKSHFFVFRVLLRELARKGHNVTVISHFPEANKPDNYRDIVLKTKKAVESSMKIQPRTYKMLYNTIGYLSAKGIENCETLLRNDQVLNLEAEEDFDVVLAEYFTTDCGFGLAHKLGAPVVGLTSHVLMPYHYSRLGISDNAAYVSSHFLEGGTKPTLYQRIERTILGALVKMNYRHVVQKYNQKTISEYLGDVPPLEDLAAEAKMVLLYHHYTLTGPRVFPTNVVEVGGYHVQPPNVLTGELKKFLDSANYGVIYISFGSVAASSSMSPHIEEAILNTIRRLPQKVIWKTANKALILNKDKVFVSDWLPQVDILAHQNTVAFLSHSGMLGTTEAIHFGVPMVAMPIFGDQPSNAAAIEESGLGVQIQIQDMNEENLYSAFKTVLSSAFRYRVRKVTKAWHDRPMTPLDTAVFWIEYVARNPNISATAPSAYTPLYKLLNLDVWLIFLLAPTLCIAGIIFLVNYIKDRKRKPTRKLKMKSKKH